MVTVRFAGTLPKIGGVADDSEDAVCTAVADDGSVFAAVADGASDSLFSAQWAKGLAEVWVSRTDEAAFSDRVTQAAARWNAFAAAQTLLWFAEPKRARGAHAAFVGVTVSAEGGWTARAVGDSCLFQVRGEQLVAAFPIETADEFPALPVLIGTNEGIPNGALRTRHGTLLSGDELYLMSDALALWFLNEAAQNREPWRWLRDMERQREPVRAFGERIDLLRGAGRLRDDDIALISLQFPEPATV